MKKRLVKIALLIILIAALAGLNGGIDFNFIRSTVRAVGDLAVDWGVPEGNPIFVVSDMAPGQTEERTVAITNGASTIRPVGVRGVPTSDPDNLSDAMHIVISRNGTELYGGASTTGPKTLAQFFSESAGPDGISLFNLNPGANTSLKFSVTFDTDAGNPFQGKTVVFDLKIGISVPVPAECNGISFSGDPIFGTQKRDNIKGTNGSDLIFTFEDNDSIYGSNGDDCIVAGSGNDRIDASNGNDVIIAGPGNDYADGGNGQDRIEGNEGNDTLIGGNLNDILIGGPGTDRATGGLGTDTCSAESRISCEL